MNKYFKIDWRKDGCPIKDINEKYLSKNELVCKLNSMANKIDRLQNHNECVPVFPDYCNNWNDLMPLVVEHLSCGAIHSCFNPHDEYPQYRLAMLLMETLSYQNKEQNECE